jgi:hypothetical protein
VELAAQGNYIPGRVGPIRDLLGGWLDYLKIPHEQAHRAAAAHRNFLEELSKAGTFTYRPIIRRDAVGPVILDGRHRLFALAARNKPDAVLEVYWETGL